MTAKIDEIYEKFSEQQRKDAQVPITNTEYVVRDVDHEAIPKEDGTREALLSYWRLNLDLWALP